MASTYVREPQILKSNPKNSEFSIPTPTSEVQSQKYGDFYTFSGTFFA